MPNYLPNAEPFYFAGNRIGCLLVHGFTGTPYEMRGLGEHLAAQGYTVLAPALAGHATRLDDMLPTRWTDWYASVTDAYAQLRAQCDMMFAIGLSLGGTLVLHLAAHRPVAGVVAVSTPFTIQNPLILLFRTFPFLYTLIPSVKKKTQEDDTLDPAVRRQHPEYSAHPTRAAASLIFDFLPHLRDDLRDVRAPVLLIQSRGDAVIPAHSMQEYHARLGARAEMRWLERGGHLALEDVSKEQAYAYILEFVQTYTRDV